MVKIITIFQNSTVGVISGGTKTGAPTIRDNVTTSAGSIIIGNINVGNNACIDAGAVVVNDVPNDEVFVGNPAKVLSLKSQ